MHADLNPPTLQPAGIGIKAACGFARPSIKIARNSQTMQETLPFSDVLWLFGLEAPAVLLAMP